jgi:hypothetical protein
LQRAGVVGAGGVDDGVARLGFAPQQPGIVERAEHRFDAERFEPRRAGRVRTRPRTRSPWPTRPAAIEPPM